MSQKKGLYKIGLTGGIASGKSKLLDYLGKEVPRVYTINLDIMGHQVYRYNPIILRNVKQIFGKKAVIQDNEGIVGVNRESLGSIVFKSMR